VVCRKPALSEVEGNVRPTGAKTCRPVRGGQPGAAVPT